MSQFSKGEHVIADFGDGNVVAHVRSLAHTNDAGEVKWGIQAPDGSVHDLAHREPADYDAAGSGGTFHAIA